MAVRRKPNPNRNFPTHCPYCASTALEPHEVDEFGWKCGECLRVFSVRFHGQDDPDNRPQPTASTHEAHLKDARKGNVMINLTGGSFVDIKRPTVTPTPPLDPAIVETNARLVEDYADSLYDASAETILTWAHEHAPGPLVVTLSMENTVLSELASRYLPDADGLFLDTGYHFPETLEVADAVEKRYPNQRLVRALPRQTVAEQDTEWGKDLFASNPTACCDLRKVDPLNRALGPYVGWVTGLRRADGPTRATAPALSLDKTGRLKISPIITWTLDDTERYIQEHDLIENPLTHKGYPSIGCAPCTRKVRPGEDPRAGRWAGFSKTECGLHQ